MNSIREFLRLLRYANARLCVSYCLWALERARDSLAKAYAAHDQALAELRLTNLRETAEPPAFLRVDNVSTLPAKTRKKGTAA